MKWKIGQVIIEASRIDILLSICPLYEVLFVKVEWCGADR